LIFLTVRAVRLEYRDGGTYAAHVKAHPALASVAQRVRCAERRLARLTDRAPKPGEFVDVQTMARHSAVQDQLPHAYRTY
jgi:hypothetical protein